MSQVINNNLTTYYEYFINGPYLALFLCSVILMFIEKRRETKIAFLGQTLVFSILYWCPITAYIIAYYCIGTDVYWRMFWLLPSTMMIAYVFTKVCNSTKDKLSKVAAPFVIAFIIMSLGLPIYNETYFQASNNLYKINPYTIEICDIVEKHAEENGVEQRGVIAPDEIIIEMKEYDGVVRIPYGRDMIRGMGKSGLPESIYFWMRHPGLPVESLVDFAEEGNYQYLVYFSAMGLDMFTDTGYTFIGEVGPYYIYYLE